MRTLENGGAAGAFDQPAPSASNPFMRVDISQQTGCFNQLSRVQGRRRVDFVDRKPANTSGE
jgi:hypothetical protein